MTKRAIIIGMFSLLTFLPGISYGILPGDIDSSGAIDLKDVIVSLQFLSEMNIAIPVYTSADVNGDDIIGIAEALYALQCLTRLRNNHSPILNAIGDKAIDEGSLLTFNISATDPDGDIVLYSANGLPSGASLYTKTREFSWLPTFQQSGSYQVTFIAADGFGGIDSETITITVNDVNHAPILNAIGDKKINEGSLLMFSISATDADGDILTYAIDNLPGGATFDKTSKTFSWTPTYRQNGVYQVAFIVSDNYGGSALARVNITVDNSVDSGENLIADTAAPFWASGSGAQWSYQMLDRRLSANQQDKLKTVDDVGEVTVAGKVAHRFEHSWSLFKSATETEYRYFDGRQIRDLEALSVEPGLEISPEDYVEVPAPLVDGETMEVLDRTAQVDIDGDGVPDLLHVEAHTTIAAEPFLSVPAGDFRALLRSRLEATATATSGTGSQTASATSVLTTWYAPGIGVVRRVYEDPSVRAPNNTATEELAGFVVGSTRAGIVPNMIALDGLGAGSSSNTPGIVDFTAGGGRMMTVSTSEAGTVEGAIHDGDGVLIWRGTVLSTNNPYKLNYATVAFDGTDFRVVAHRSIPYNSPTENALISQRVTASGGLRDGPTGSLLDSGIPDASQTVWGLRAAARQGRLLVSWGRYDTTYAPVAPGLVTQRGYVIEGRMYNDQQQPVAERFELGSGLPETLAVREDQYIIINTSQNGVVSTLNSWAIDINGVPVSVPPQILNNTPLPKGDAKLQMAGDELWLSYLEYSSSDWGMPVPPAKLIAARLGRDGALLDGTADAPGYTILQQDSANVTGRTLAIGAGRSLLVWSEGWNTLRATLFDNSVLTGASKLPSTFISLAPDKPNAVAEPSRSILMVADTGKAFYVGWLDNEQSYTAKSDRVMFTLIYPRYVAP